MSISRQGVVVNELEVRLVQNFEIKTELLRNRIQQYKLAEWLGVSEWTLSRQLRKELDEVTKNHILNIIRKKVEDNASANSD